MLLKEALTRFKEHVGGPILEKVRLLNATSNGVGGISSLSNVNEGLPVQSKRFRASYEIQLEAQRRGRYSRSQVDKYTSAEQEETEAMLYE